MNKKYTIPVAFTSELIQMIAKKEISTANATKVVAAYLERIKRCA
jgi:hypothetical protein